MVGHVSRSLFGTLLWIVFAGCGGGGGNPNATPTPTPKTYAQALLGGLEKGSIEKTRSDMNAIGTAIGGYMGETGAYPIADDFDALGRFIAPMYIRILPPTDAWQSKFVFSGSAQAWTLTAPGQDGKAGTGDDIVLTEHGFTKLPDGYRPSF